MSALQIRLERIGIVLQGIPVELVEQAVSGLEPLLRRRLQGWRPAAAEQIDIAGLALDPVRAAPGLDAAGLRALLAEQIETGLRRALGPAGGAEGGDG
ncbi:MAG TPA: hypothetical protein ENI96_13470 [Sedimenticola thiotaurini]|uniref:Uncharacterized protein n=1 Tax=Sedimenticola thiotaurini TaxID=1543721 RepID=A0A831RQ47_9GAMM|nr:hypothetical protein [Sedimenticola thiotaurini]